MDYITEDVWGAQVDAATGVVYLTTLDMFDATGLPGDGNDVFTCTLGTLGNNRSCPLALYFDGDSYELTGERIDALAVLEPASVAAARIRLTTETDPRDSVESYADDEGYDDVDDHLEDVDDTLNESSGTLRLFLPYLQQ